MAALQIYQFPCLSDNFGVLIHDPEANVTASIDAPEAGKVTAALKEKGWKLTHILTTHHHADHTGGNAALKAASGCKIVGPRNEAAKVPGIDEKVGGGDSFAFGPHQVEVLDTPGDTAGHIAYVIPSAKVAFVGDTLFAVGCSRVIEGTPQMMWESLRKLMALPRDTAVYCGHEYTQANVKFALTIEPDSAALQKRAKDVDETRAAGKATLPTTIGLELDTNPFLRPHVPAIQKRLGMEGRPEWEVFAEIRERKNRS
jgi:hydroxyacylglutathione hydrolase